MKKKTKKRPSTQGAANPKRFDLDKGRSIELNDIVHGAEDLSDQRRMDEFRAKVELERGFAEAWLTKDGEDPAEVGTYLYRRIAMVRGEPNRALYKLGMLDVARRCICSIVMLEWAESSLDVGHANACHQPFDFIGRQVRLRREGLRACHADLHAGRRRGIEVPPAGPCRT